MFMVKSFPFVAAYVTALAIGMGAPAACDPILLSTLEWPPYTSSFLPEEGAAADVVRKAFAPSGTEISLLFLPWNRAVAKAREAETVLAYFPGYDCDRNSGFLASDPLGHGPLGFAQSIKHPLEWSDLNDLADKGLKFGTVLGYSNTEPFDQLAEQGRIKVRTAKDDLANLRGLIAGRVDAAVIDRRVMRYLVGTEPSLWAQRVRIGFHTQLLANVPLHVCFRDSDRGREMRHTFNAGLATLGDPDAVIDAYLTREFD